MNEIISDLGIAGITYFYVILTIFVPLMLYKKEKINKFTARKSVHLSAGLAVLSSPFFYWPFWPTIIAGTNIIRIF
jgi:hypothetical protein